MPNASGVCYSNRIELSYSSIEEILESLLFAIDDSTTFEMESTRNRIRLFENSPGFFGRESLWWVQRFSLKKLSR